MAFGEVFRKDAKGGANPFGLHRSLCGSTADRARRPPVRACLSMQLRHVHRTCLRVQGRLEVWKLGGLEAWLSLYKSLGRACWHVHRSFLSTSLWVVLVGTSIGRAGGAGRTSPCRGVGQRPTSPITNFLILQSPNQPISQSANQPIPLCVPLWFFVSFVSAPQGKHSTVLPQPRPSPRRGALFSVLCSPFSGMP